MADELKRPAAIFATLLFESLWRLRMEGHSKSANRSGIKLEWEAYAKAVKADTWAGGASSSQLEELVKSLAQVGMSLGAYMLLPCK